MKYLKMILVFVLVVSCNKKEITEIKTNTDSVVVSLPYMWKKSLHKNGVLSNGSIRKAIYYNKAIAIPTTNGANNRLMTLINSENGETIWSWDDRYQPQTEDVFITSCHQYNNLVTYQNGKRSYCINLDNGNTQWKEVRDNYFLIQLSGLNSVFFSFGQSQTQYQQYSESIAFKGSMQTGVLEEFIIPNFTINNIAPGNRIGDITGITPYLYNNIQYLTVIWQEPQNINSINDWQSYLGLYNYENNQWVYEKTIINQPNISGVLLAEPVIYNDKIYVNIGKELFCHNITTGTQIWRKSFSQDFLFSGFIIAEGKIIATNEDTYTYCLDPNTGQILWKTETSGTSGRMSALNGIVYFVGGSSNKLHAIDVNTGEHVWKIEASYLENNSSGFKTNAIYVFPATNGKPAKVIALSHLYAYCFEAYR